MPYPGGKCYQQNKSGRNEQIITFNIWRRLMILNTMKPVTRVFTAMYRAKIVQVASRGNELKSAYQMKIH